MEYSHWAYAALAAAAACYAVRRILQKSPNFPPSPPSTFVLGHALRIPQSQQWKTFAEWGKTYGSVVYAQALGRSMIIINSVAAARDLMEKKSANFSDRPNMPFINLLGWDVILATLPYGSTQFRKQRRWSQQYLGSSAMQSFNGIQEDETQKLLQRLLSDPDGFYDHLHGHVASIIVRAVYGHEISGDPMEDTLIKQTELAAKLTTATGSIGGTFIDIFPFLRHVPAWFPGMGLKRQAFEIRKILDVVFSSPFEEVKSKKSAGTASLSIIYRLIDQLESAGAITSQDEEDMKNFGGTFYNAGTDTTRTALQMFILMMVFHPEIQERAREEIDTTIGLDRLPLLSDRPSLPYIDCIVKEVLRVNPPVPLGVPHQSMDADEYNGWTIPARSMIIPNIWRMMRDEKHFPDPEKFDPDRYVLDGERKRAGDSVPEDPTAPVFGFGRRVCPGRALAESMMWLTIANILAAFEIRPYGDPVSGKETFPAVEFESEIVNTVKRFKCAIVPRKERLAQVTSET